MKRVLAKADDFFYRVLLKNLLKTSKLGHGLIVTGAEAGTNYEYMYDNKPEGRFFIGRLIDKILLNLPAVHATRGRKDDIRKVLWNEIHNNVFRGKKTRVLDLASGASRYLRELAEEHRQGMIESLCIDKDGGSIHLGRVLSRKAGVCNIKFMKADIFCLDRLRKLSEKKKWWPNVIIVAGFFIYFNDEFVERVIADIFKELPDGGLLVFSSYEKLNTRKLMRKTMATKSGEEWVLYYRKPEYWRALLLRVGFAQVFIFRDHWGMNNIVTARK